LEVEIEFIDDMKASEIWDKISELLETSALDPAERYPANSDESEGV
jgi:hypothetical protein